MIIFVCKEWETIKKLYFNKIDMAKFRYKITTLVNIFLLDVKFGKFTIGFVGGFLVSAPN